MSGKPRSEWSEAYRRRVERAEAAGKTRQQARGHREKEHVHRRERERRVAAEKAIAEQRRAEQERIAAERERIRKALLPPNKSQRAYVRKHARLIAARTGEDADEVVKHALSMANDYGYAWFKAQIAIIRENHAWFVGAVLDGTYESRGQALLQHWTDRNGFPDSAWYYYHTM